MNTFRKAITIAKFLLSTILIVGMVWLVIEQWIPAFQPQTPIFFSVLIAIFIVVVSIVVFAEVDDRFPNSRFAKMVTLVALATMAFFLSRAPFIVHSSVFSGYEIILDGSTIQGIREYALSPIRVGEKIRIINIRQLDIEIKEIRTNEVTVVYSKISQNSLVGIDINDLDKIKEERIAEIRRWLSDPAHDPHNIPASIYYPEATIKSTIKTTRASKSNVVF